MVSKDRYAIDVASKAVAIFAKEASEEHARLKGGGGGVGGSWNEEKKEKKKDKKKGKK